MSASKRVERVLVDSNIFLRILVKEDKRMFEDCQTFFTRLEEGTISAYTPTIIIAEVSFVLASWYKFTKVRILSAAEGIVTSSGLEVVDDVRLPHALELYKTHSVKLIDCILASSKRLEESATALLSYDQDFDKIGVRRVEPGDLLKKFSKK